MAAANDLEFQYEVNRESAESLGFFRRRNYPSIECVTEDAAKFVESDDDLVVITPSVTTLPYVSVVHGQPSILANYGGHKGFGIRNWGGFWLRKTSGSDPTHNRHTAHPYDIAVVSRGLAEDAQEGLVHRGLTVAEQVAVLAENSETPMTAIQYFALNALRIDLGLVLTDTQSTATRFVHYPIKGTGFDRKIPVGSGGFNTVNIQEFSSDVTTPGAGVRVVREVA